MERYKRVAKILKELQSAISETHHNQIHADGYAKYLSGALWIALDNLDLEATQAVFLIGRFAEEMKEKDNE